MTRDEIIEHLRVSLCVVLNTEIAEFDESMLLLEDLQLDSLRFVELIMSLEDTIGLDVDPDTLEPEVFTSVGTLADYAEQRLAATAA